MAYLKPTTLTCSDCDFTAEIRIVVGVGPRSEAGDTPYRRYQSAGGFMTGTKEDGSPDGTLRCPNDGTVVWTNQAGAKGANTNTATHLGSTARHDMGSSCVPYDAKTLREQP